MPNWPYQGAGTGTVSDNIAGADGIASFPNAAAPGNSVSLAEVLRDVWGGLMGTGAGNNGVQTFPSAAAPANNVSIAEVLRSVYNLLVPVVITGTTDIDDSVQTETSAFPILTIAPAAGSPLVACEVWLDLAKATTGFAAVESSITVTIAVARKVDGTNWRRQVINEAALSGTLAASRMQKVDLGAVTVTEGARLEVTFSSDVTSDMEIPYAVVYRTALTAPTITDVAAG